MTWIDMMFKKGKQSDIKLMVETNGYGAAILYCKIQGWKQQAQQLQQEWDEKLKNGKQR